MVVIGEVFVVLHDELDAVDIVFVEVPGFLIVGQNNVGDNLLDDNGGILCIEGAFLRGFEGKSMRALG